MTSARPVHIAHSTVSAPIAMTTKESQPMRGAGTRLLRTTGPAKYRTAISKNRMKKISMLMPWIVSMR
jgi:hypothetical protein